MLVLDRFQFPVLISASQETAILSWKICFLRHVMKCTIYSIQSSNNILVAHKQYIPTDTLMFFTQRFWYVLDLIKYNKNYHIQPKLVFILPSNFIIPKVLKNWTNQIERFQYLI